LVSASIPPGLIVVGGPERAKELKLRRSRSVPKQEVGDEQREENNDIG